MIKVISLYLLWIWTTSLVLHIAANPSNITCDMKTNTPIAKEYWCRSGFPDPLLRVIAESDEMIQIVCQEVHDTDYMKYFDKINATTFPKFKKFLLKQCPLPNISFRKFFDILGIKSVEKLEFDSQLNISNQLKPFYFENLTTVEEIVLSNNKISHLEESTFIGVPNLEILNLKNNRIKNITKKFIESIRQLKDLEIGLNPLSALDGYIFKDTNLNILRVGSTSLEIASNMSHLTKLGTLDLSDNVIERVDGMFDTMVNLTWLNLNWNNITYVPENLFANNPKLDYLSLSKTFNRIITTLPSGLFSNLTSLTYLRLAGNNLVTLPNEIFRNTTSLKNLDLSYNKLQVLNGSILHSLKNLISLQLQNNRLYVIGSDVFSTLKKLEEINLNYNNLTVYQDTFYGLEKVKKINLNDNRASFVPLSGPNTPINLFDDFSPFNRNVDLEELYLRNNSLTALNMNWFVVHSKIKKVDISYNKITKVTFNDIYFPQNNIVNLDLSNNNIKTIDLSDAEWTLRSQTGFLSDTNVTLSNNPINCNCFAYSLASYFQNKIDRLVIQHLELQPRNMLSCHSPESLRNTTLKEINLSDLSCPLKEWKPKQYENCTSRCDLNYRPVDRTVVVNCSHTNLNLNELSQHICNLDRQYSMSVELLFTHNNLQSLDGLQKLNLTKQLRKLVLSHNKLENIDDIVIFPMLETLELDHNKLSALSEDVIQRFTSSSNLTYITLHNNPWKCNCNTKYLANFLSSHQHKEIPHPEYIQCKEDGNLIIRLSVDDLCKISLTLIVACVSVASFFVIAGVFIALFSIYEYEIKVWLFAHKILLFWVSEKEIDKDKEYDAFISYSHKDRVFVENYLVPTLEDQNSEISYRVCVHLRNFPAGGFVAGGIAKAIESSRRTIIILSPDFIKSEWARMEFRLAHLKAMKEKCARVIVVLLKEVDMQELEPELKAYVIMNTYVKWGDPNFWPKLRYALPHPNYFPKQRVNIAHFTEAELRRQLDLLNKEKILNA